MGVLVAHDPSAAVDVENNGQFPLGRFGRTKRVDAMPVGPTFRSRSLISAGISFLGLAWA